MNTDHSAPDDKQSGLERLARDIRGQLKAGGPPPDWAAIHLYIAGDLGAEDMQRVRQRIVTWETWHQAYWQTVALLEPSEQRDREDGDQQTAEPDAPRTMPRREAGPQSRRRSLRTWAIVATAATILIAVGSVVWVQNMDRGGRVVAYVDDPFGRVTKTARGEVRGLQAFPEEWRGPLGEMLRTEAVEVPEAPIESLRVTRGKLPSIYVRPVLTVVRSDRPTFEWHARGSQARYQVTVYEWGELDPVVQSGQTRETRWTPDKPLKRGSDYSWQVDVFGGDAAEAPDAPRAPFRILDAEGFAKLEEQERIAKGSHLLLAVIYLKAALLDDAQRELESLKQEQGAAAVVDKLLESLRQHR